MHIKQGDTVQIVAGADRGKTGEVERVIPQQGKIIVAGINIKKHHIRGRRQGQQGQILEVAHPIDHSNAMLVDPKTKKPTRIRIERADGKKKRISKASGQAV